METIYTGAEIQDLREYLLVGIGVDAGRLLRGGGVDQAAAEFIVTTRVADIDCRGVRRYSNWLTDKLALTASYRAAMLAT